MSGKLIHKLKRKRAELAATQSDKSNDSAESADVEYRSNLADAPSAPRKKAKSEPTPRDDKDDSDDSPHRRDVLRDALRKVQALQAELAALDEASDADFELDYDSGNDEDESELMAFEAEALGFAVCARETMMFLAAQGLTADHPLVRNLRSRLVGKCSGLPI